MDIRSWLGQVIEGVKCLWRLYPASFAVAEIKIWLLPLPRRFVVFALSIAFGAALSVFSLENIALLLLAVIFFLACSALAGHLRFGLICCLSAALAYLYALWRVPVPGPEDISQLNGTGRITLRGQVVQLKEYRNGAGKRILFRVDDCDIKPELCGLVDLHIYAHKTQDEYERKIQDKCAHKIQDKLSAQVDIPALYDCIEVAASLTPPAERRHDWEWNDAARLKKAGVFSQSRVSVSAIKIIAQKNCSPPQLSEILERAVEKIVVNWRKTIIRAHTVALGNENGELLVSMVLGDRAVELDSKIIDSFRKIGLSHVLAASGFNLTIVGALLYCLARCVSKSSMFINTVSFAGIVFFVAIAGGSPSIWRAAAICSLALYARCFYRSLYLPAALSAALIFFVLWEPSSLCDLGFQLSYLATAGLVAGASIVIELLSCLRRYLPAWFLDLLGATLAAQAAVLPLQVYYFWQISSLFLVANLLISPVVPIVTVCGFLSTMILGLCHFLPFLLTLARGLDGLLFYPLEAIKLTVYGLASLPGAVLIVGRPDLPVVLFYYAGLFGFFLLFPVRQLRLMLFLSYSLGLILLFVRLPLEQEVQVRVGFRRLIINKNRTASWEGRNAEPRIQRILAFYGARLIEKSQR